MKLCCIFTNAPHYRSAIYKLIDKNYDCDWFFNNRQTNIKRLDYSLLTGNVTIQKYYELPFGFTYQKGVISQLFKPYDKYFIFLYSNSLSTWLFLLLSKLFPRKRVYGWTHGWYGKETKWQAFLKKLIFKRADEIFTYGNYARELMIKEGFNPQCIHTLHNSLDYDKQLELRKGGLKSDIFKHHFNNENKTLIFIGRLTPVKKLDMLIKVLATLQKKGENYNLVFVGDGTEMEKLVLLSENLKVKDKVWFYGACYDEKTNAELIYNADLCVAPGNVGLTAMHTMVFGTPVISHDNFPYQMPEFEAIIPNKTGCFFKMDDVNDLAFKISEWFKNNGEYREEIRKECMKEIDLQWNPYFQIDVIKKNIR